MGLIEKQRIQQSFYKALGSYDENAWIQKKINRQLITRLMANLSATSLKSILELGCGTGQLTEQLQQRIQAEHWMLNDLCDVKAQLYERLSQPFEFYCGDAEQFPFNRKYDLIITASVVQWFHHKAKFIQHCKSGLNPNGLLAISTFGQENLKEIRKLTQIGLDYPDLSDWKRWLQADFDLLYSDITTEELVFPTPIGVLKHLKNTGVTAIGKGHWTKGQLNEFINRYQQHFSLSGKKVRLTYQPLWLIAQYKE
ncbi:malonyl-ACP O-methyltransferase BioC [Rodentibacter haemolyticus]|uniref:malonyl-ACP O-methyltransferase BioC n=1 Tax=Rodentibacter haemolyticus TaxID=2778911 RepID=UPI001E591139|nr:malonyl-ACP O-methyltransferase BioC [Rodentibacter haemolyticus]